MKYVLVTGGVISGIGKGVVASSVGVILKHCNVPATRLDGDYWNYFIICSRLKSSNCT